jgi:hypothetical protein
LHQAVVVVEKVSILIFKKSLTFESNRSIVILFFY